MPNAARYKRQGGMCFVSVVIDSKGLPQNPRVIRCTDSMFEKNSLDAIRQYRFKPAFRTSDGTPVAVSVTVEINFRFDAYGPPDDAPVQIRYGFFSPPGTRSGDPDADGTYPFSKRLEGPAITQFISKGFGQAAAVFPDGTSCKVVLVLDAKGKPLNATISQCDKPTLEQPAIDSLMKSKYKPAKLNGKEVPVRLLVYLVYEGFGPHPQITRDHGAP
jgi:TonB family protein